MAKHELWELQQWQALPLNIKIRMTQERIRSWVNEYGEDGVYVSFSGGKDSTVLLHIVRNLYPNIKAVFVDTGLEYPEIRVFVKSFDNVYWLRPKMNFKQVIEKYGYPFISKEVSECVDGARKYIKILTDRQTDRQTVPYAQFYRKLQGTDEYKKQIPIRVEQAMRTGKVCSEVRGGGHDNKYRKLRGIGEYHTNRKNTTQTKVADEYADKGQQSGDGEYP